MEKKWILLIAILIFLIYIFLFWALTSGNAKKKIWNKDVETLANEIIILASGNIL
jgi:hypothetical protein